MFGHNEPDDENNNSAHEQPVADASLSAPDPVESPVDSPVDAPTDITGPVSAPAIDDTPVDSPSDDSLSSEPSSSPSISDSPTSVGTDDLLNIKKDALEELAPLIAHLDQSPEERFKTTMMMIQATDASGLIQKAHDAAKEITDEKVRAQALLDIVNEINYFTHANSGSADSAK